MRILQIVQKPQRRGAEVFARQLSTWLLREGHPLRTIYLYPPPQFNALPLRDGDLVIGNDEAHFSEKMPGWNPRILRRLAAIVHEFRPDVVQLNGARTLKYGTLVKTLTGCRPVVIYRNIGDPSVWLHRRWQRWFYRTFLIPKLDGIVAVSSGSLEMFKSFCDKRPRIVHIPTGVDPDLLVPRKARKAVREQLATSIEAPVIVFVGSLTAEKKVERLLRILRMIRSKIPDVQLWIVGDGLLREALETEAETLGISQHVRFLGSCDDVASYISAADLFVLASDTEGVPAVILEAAILGVPSVAANVGGVPDCILHKETGFLVNPSDQSGMETIVTQLLLNPRERVAMGARAKHWVGHNFGMEKIAAEYLQFYHQLLRARSAGHS